MLDFEIPVMDREDWEKQEKINQELHMHFCLNDFGELVQQYGVEKIMKELDEETYWVLEKWFIRGVTK